MPSLGSLFRIPAPTLLLACRLGGNYLMLPVNAPKCAHHNNHHDGVMNFMQRSEEVRGASAANTHTCVSGPPVFAGGLVFVFADHINDTTTAG